MNEIEIDIKLDTIKKVKSFIEAVTKYNDDITVKSYRYEIDAKSIMAIFSLNLLDNIRVCLYSKDKAIQKKFINDMKIFQEGV